MMKFRDSIVAKAGDQAKNTARAVDMTISGVCALLPLVPLPKITLSWLTRKRAACIALQRSPPFKKPPPRISQKLMTPKTRGCLILHRLCLCRLIQTVWSTHCSSWDASLGIYVVSSSATTINRLNRIPRRWL